MGYSIKKKQSKRRVAKRRQNKTRYSKRRRNYKKGGMNGLSTPVSSTPPHVNQHPGSPNIVGQGSPNIVGQGSPNNYYGQGTPLIGTPVQFNQNLGFGTPPQSPNHNIHFDIMNAGPNSPNSVTDDPGDWVK